MRTIAPRRAPRQLLLLGLFALAVLAACQPSKPPPPPAPPAPTVTALSPTSGPETGGNGVVITGSGFAGPITVTFGGLPAVSALSGDTELIAVAPGGTGTVDVRITTAGGTTANTTSDDYTYIPAAPAITSLNPTAGPEAGGNDVTVTGSGFTGATAVDFDSNPATSFTVDSATQITATAPPGTGLVDVVVTTPEGTSASTPADDYTYVPAPTVTGLSPTSGPAAGGNSVTVTGTNFAGATAVDFGATPATSFIVDSATQITATAPAGTGVVDVTVTTPGGTSANTAADNYTYMPAPTVTALNPTSGLETGGNNVTITGTNLLGATAVNFGATPATSFVALNDTTIGANAPAGTAGTVDVTVTGPGGTSANTLADDYTYTPATTVTSLNPTAGPEAGGNTVTITGTNFTGATAVTFADPAITFTVDSPTQITATAPAGLFTVDVTVTTPLGTSADTPADDYTYAPAPTISTISPTNGPVAGGTVVTITGTDFIGVSAVDFGATPATTFTADSATQITATAPAGTGTVDVSVTAAGGTSANTAPDDYTYLPAPTITGLNPTSGPASGGTDVIIAGSGFTFVTEVRFGGVLATGFTFVADSQIIATSPAGSGVVDVTVTTPGGTNANTTADDYTYFPGPPAITSLNPIAGPAAGGNTVTITGTDFTGATAVDFGFPAAFTVDSPTQITATTPANVGTVHVTVTTPLGTSADTPADDYTFASAPGITSLNPTAGPVAGGTVVTITGGDFIGVTAVTFGGTPATTFVADSATQITATAPAGTGTVDVSVTAAGGTTANTSFDDFFYLPTPTITLLTPNSGPATGGNGVTIDGTGFTLATEVRFGGVLATDFTIVSDFQIFAIEPAGTGTVDVTVTTPGGTNANTAADDYTYL